MSVLCLSVSVLCLSVSVSGLCLCCVCAVSVLCLCVSEQVCVCVNGYPFKPKLFICRHSDVILSFDLDSSSISQVSFMCVSLARFSLR